MSKEKGGACVLHLQGADGEVTNVIVPTNNITKLRRKAWETNGFKGELGYQDHKLVGITDIKGDVSYFNDGVNFSEKYIHIDEIIDEYDSLPIEKKLIVSNGALDYMQQYNGRSSWVCRAMAMGYENSEGESGTWTRKE